MRATEFLTEKKKKKKGRKYYGGYFFPGYAYYGGYSGDGEGGGDGGGESVNELYEPESSFPLNWYPSHDPSEASARAYDRNKGYIDIKFTPILGSDDMVEVEFSRNDSYDMTGGGDANRVLGTVLQAFREYLQGYQPKILVFSAKGSSRSKVYQNLIKRFASTVGYKQFDINKLSPETQEKIAFSGSDLMVLRKMYK